MEQSIAITCPNCATRIDIDEVFYKQVEERLKAKHQAKWQQLTQELEAKRQEYKSHFEALKQQQLRLEKEKEDFEAKLDEALRRQLQKEKTNLMQSLRRELAAEHDTAMEMMRKELEAKTKQVQELTKAKMEIERLKREREELVLEAKLEAEKRFGKLLEAEKEKLQRMIASQAEEKIKKYQETQALKLKEKDEQLQQLKRSLEEAKRKAEQGSMQVQGEALELTVEGWLRACFPFDTIEEVKKGAFGADCIQTVHTREAHHCGVIVYESKNAKGWNDEWIAKLKRDMLKAKGDIGVLVTTVYPKGMERMGWVEGIWVCSIEEFKGSCALLRESLIRVHKAVGKEENKADKMQLLYNYLTGNEFQMQLRAIVDGFIKMQEELEKEKRSVTASWKRRQKMIDQVLINTTEMYGSLQAIAGRGAIAHIEALELPDSFEE